MEKRFQKKRALLKFGNSSERYSIMAAEVRPEILSRPHTEKKSVSQADGGAWHEGSALV